MAQELQQDSLQKENEELKIQLKRLTNRVADLEDTPGGTYVPSGIKAIVDYPSGPVVAGASPGGSDKEIQFNDNGSFGGNVNFSYDTSDGGGFSAVAAAGASGDGAGGEVYLQGGTGGSTDGAGGLTSLLGGANTGNGNGGGVLVQAADASGNGNGGDLTLIAGGALGSGTPGALFMASGELTQATRRYFDTVNTTNATPTTLFTFSPGSSTSFLYEVKVKALRTGGAAGSAQDSAGYVVRAVYKRVGTAAPTLVGAISQIFVAEDQSGWDCTFAVSGNNVLVQVTGATDNNVTWRGELIINR